MHYLSLVNALENWAWFAMFVAKRIDYLCQKNALKIAQKMCKKHFLTGLKSEKPFEKQVLQQCKKLFWAVAVFT